MGSRSWLGAVGTVAIMLAVGTHVSPARGDGWPESRRRVAGATATALSISPETPRDLRSAESKAGRRLRTTAGATALAVDREVRPAATASSATGSVAGTLCSQPDGNCQQRDTFDALTSNRTRFITADDFRPTADGSITSICWWGAYARRVSDRFVDCVGEAQDTYEVKYYEDAGGVPGVVLESFSQADGTLSVTGPIPTGNIVGPVINQIPEYALTATHAPVSVQAGGCYWIEITNNTLTCTWFWVIGTQANGFATQGGNGVDPPDGYSVGEWISNDMGFCLDVPLADSAPCAPAAPGNDDCAEAELISTEGVFAFDNTFARTDGPEHDNCLAFGDTRMESDVWYCWTAPPLCTDSVYAATCGLTDVDTWIAVYDGCACPVGGANLLACNDDLCGNPSDARQSLTVFSAVAGQSYLIRVGSYPGEPRGAGSLRLTCGPPENPSCPGDGDCCGGTASPACEDELCCRTVCACDPFCCEVEWDEFCAMGNLAVPGCDAIALCPADCDICGNPAAGDCCTETLDFRGCSDAECCEAVCALDSFCCENKWDISCATDGVNHSGFGAEVLCPTLCGTGSCPTGPVSFVEPLDGVVDARQPYPPANPETRQGIDTIIAEAPAGADNAACWSLCESAVDGTANGIAGVVDNGNGTVTISLLRSISTGAVTTITYTDDAGAAQTGTLTSHPANTDGDSAAGPPDILKIIDYLNGVANSPWGIYSEDVDHSDSLQPPDILRVIDLLNGAGSFDAWLNTPLPGCGNCCVP